MLSRVIDKAWDKFSENDKKAFIDGCGYSGKDSHILLKGAGPGMFLPYFDRRVLNRTKCPSSLPILYHVKFLIGDFPLLLMQL